MESSRRSWLKQIGMGAAGLGLAQLDAFALPAPGVTRRQSIDGPVRLSSNENPYGPSPMARAAMADQVNASNRYNWELTTALIALLAKRNNVNDDNILTRAGSTEVLDAVVRLAAAQKGSFIMADPTYSYWSHTAQALGLKKIAVPLTADKRHDLPAILKAIQPDTRLIYICNPNNPTGTICDREALIAFIREASKKTLVLVDEAYIDFTRQQSLSALVLENKNLVIAKTFSKIYGLAGARLGYAIAHAATLEQLSQLQSWVNGGVSVVSVAGALASLNDETFVKDTYTLNEKAKAYTIKELERLGVPSIPSHTNFLYFSLAGYTKDFFEQLKKNNIAGTRIYEEQGKWSRITIGTMQEMQQFIAALG